MNAQTRLVEMVNLHLISIHKLPPSGRSRVIIPKITFFLVNVFVCLLYK
uniref:Uncharacterized protein n=1 Tax=Anguilla anguilla TaxID=7936 RepID=A0A0E9U3R5_ANGAN